MAFLFEVYITLLVCYLYSVVSDRALVPTVIDLPASLSMLSSPSIVKLHGLSSSHAFSFPLFPHLHIQKTNPSNVHACLACQTTAQLNSHPAFPEPVGPFWQGSSLCWRSPRCAVLAKTKSLKLQTLPVSDAAIKPGWWKSSASEKEEVRSLTWGI